MLLARIRIRVGVLMKRSPLPITFLENVDLSLRWIHESIVFFRDIVVYPITTVSNNFHYLVTSEQDWHEVDGDIFLISSEKIKILRHIAVPTTILPHEKVRRAVNFENASENRT